MKTWLSIRSSLMTLTIIGGLISTGAGAATEVKPDLQGAKEIIKLLQRDAAAESSAAQNRPAELLARLQSFREMPNATNAANRAKQWIEMAFTMATWQQTDFLQSYSSLDPETGKPVSFESLLTVMPPPDEWGALWQAFEAYDTSATPAPFVAGLRLFVAALAPDGNRLEEAVRAYEKVSAQAGEERTKHTLLALLPHIETTVALRTNNMERLLENLEAEAKSPESRRDTVEVPDVINILGRDKATAWLSKIITSARRSISVPVGDATRTEARSIALARADDLQAAHWGLVSDFESIPLYEALLERFPSAGSVADFYGSRRDAQIYYLLSLIGGNRIDDAAQQLRALARENEFSLTSQMLQDLEAAGYSEQIQAFLQTLLKDDPSLNVWSPYLKLSARVGKADSAADFVKELIDRHPTDSGAPADLAVRYAEALLALNDVENALTILSSSMASADLDTRSDLGLKLGRLGMLLEDAKLVDRGFQTMSEVLNQTRGEEKNYWRDSALESFIALARDVGRFGDAEAFLREEMIFLQNYLAKYAELAGTQGDVYFSQYLKPLAVELAGVYAAAGNWEDVITWLDEFPYWGAADIASIITAKDGAGDPLGIHLARALVESGKTGEAQSVLRLLLRRIPDDDRVYEMFSRVDPNSAITKYDELFAVDQFEERPMIWKAKRLLDEGEIEKARSTIELAIAVDPSDGEQGPGDRMRAYAVYATILDAEGDLDKANVMREAVKAIRLSEDADRYYDAGLYTRAIEMYEQSAQQFDGAYCVQSRLAIQLTERGRFADAAPHFERAYSLMPESFGRVESHCFRCESVFDDVRAQGIADSVFSAMLTTNSANPKTEYMVGYLRKEQGRYAEALEHFRAAVGIDPLYLSAWKQIGDIGKKMHIEAWEANGAAIRIRELDPLRRHSRVDYSLVTDLPGLWNVSARIYDQIGETPGITYPLKASAALAEAQTQEKNSQAMLVNFMNAANKSDAVVLHPAMEIAKTPLIAAAMRTMFISQNANF